MKSAKQWKEDMESNRKTEKIEKEKLKRNGRIAKLMGR